MDKGYVKIPIDRYDELIKKEEVVDKMTEAVKLAVEEVKSEVTENWSSLREDVK